MMIERAALSAILDGWADGSGPSALVMNEKLIPVEGKDGVVFPPTYSDIGYNINKLSDGTLIAQIDSVGSQANRMEPLFKCAREGSADKLVPQIEITAGEKTVHLLDVGHRLSDAIIRCSTLGEKAEKAFKQFMEGDATEIAKLAPTTLVFGAWNSRSENNQAKLPRIVQSVIRAYDIEVLHRAAQYNPPLNYKLESLLGAMDGEESTEKGEKEKEARSKLGYHHSPAVWRDNKKAKDDGNRILGGVLVRGEVRRTVTVNLVVLRSLGGGEDGGAKLRRYILGLSLVAATAPQDGFLRQGCILVQDWEASPPLWQAVFPTKQPETLNLSCEDALKYAKTAAENFVIGPDIYDASFDIAQARQELDEKKSGTGKKSAKPKKK